MSSSPSAEARAYAALRLFFSATLLATVALVSGPARADERCSGTFCDLYYGGPAPEGSAAKPQAAPQPLTVPTLTAPGTGLLGKMFGTPAQQPKGTAAPGTRPLMGVGGGGIAAMARGEAPERCSGTFCDLYYGGPPPEKPAQPADAQAAAPPPEPEADADPAPAPRRGHRVREAVEAPPPRCASAMGRDPWACYR